MIIKGKLINQTASSNSVPLIMSFDHSWSSKRS